MNIDFGFVDLLLETMLQVCDFARSSVPAPLFTYDNAPLNLVSEYGFEALGSYSAATHVISLYPASIERCAGDLKLESRMISDIVLAHELAHLVTHLGKSPHAHSKRWETFSNASVTLKEWAAQSLAFHSLKGDLKRLQAFERLAKECPAPYQNWERKDCFPYDLYAASGRQVTKGDLLSQGIDE